MHDDMTRIIVGLGNPGPRYAGNRHNIGFRVVEELARRLALEFDRHGANYTAAGDPDGERQLVLIKPQTYMNLSGEGLVQWADDTGVEVTGVAAPIVAMPAVDDPAEYDEPAALEAAPSEIEAVGHRPLVICDDLALPLGAVRLRPRGSSGGQNGLASLIMHLGGEAFPRLRLGIAPAETEVPPEHWPDYVTSDFDPEDADLVEDVVNHACNAVEFWLEHDLEQTASRFNRRRPPASA